MMAPPGEPGYSMPCDAADDPVMPPERGYDHPQMGGDMAMPAPMNMNIAMMGQNDTLESMGMNPDGFGGAYESGTMDTATDGALDRGGPAGEYVIDIKLLFKSLGE